MRRWWLGLIFVVLFGALVANRAMVYAQEGTTDAGAAAAPAETSGGGTGEAAPAETGGGGTPAATPAGGAAKTAEGGTPGQSVFQMVMQNSGAPGFSIIFLSFVALYMSLRFFFQIRPQELMPPALVMKVQDDLDNGRLREAVEACSLTDCAFSRMIKASLLKIDGGYDAMVSGMEEQGGVEAIRTQQTVNWLAVIGAIAPMLGLLGTVQGMMGAFGVIGSSETTPPPRDLARWIQLALVTTVEGLVVAIPVLMAYSWFRVRITNNMLLLGAAGLDIVDRFKGVEITPAMVAEVREAAHLRSGSVAAPAQEEAPPPVEEGAPPPPPPE